RQPSSQARKVGAKERLDFSALLIGQVGGPERHSLVIQIVVRSRNLQPLHICWQRNKVAGLSLRQLGHLPAKKSAKSNAGTCDLVPGLTASSLSASRTSGSARASLAIAAMNADSPVPPDSMTYETDSRMFRSSSAFVTSPMH